MGGGAAVRVGVGDRAGQPLTHVAIVARELGVPTVVQVKDITKRIRTGMRIRVDGTTGTVTVLSGAEPGDE